MTIIVWILMIFSVCYYGCSPIRFHEGIGGVTAQGQQNSVSAECAKDPANCSYQQSDSIFKTGRREIRPGYLEESFKIPQRDELEIVLVLDVSGSMDHNLTKTGQNLKGLLSHIQHKKWRMAFMTADHGDHHEIAKKHSGQKVYPHQKWEDYQEDKPRFGKFMPLERKGKELDQFILNHNTPDYAQIFKDTVTRTNPNNCRLAPYCQGDHEQPLRSLKSSFLRASTEQVKKLFYQPNTDTVVIILTDEDERGYDPDTATPAEQVLATFNKVFKGMGKRLFAFSISVQDPACYEKERGGSFGVEYGRRVGRLSDITLGEGGTLSGNVSLCAEDYGQALSHISQITRAATQSISLEKIFYIPDTVQVKLSPKQPNVSWHFSGRKLVFSNNIRPNTSITVRYQYELRD